MDAVCSLLDVFAAFLHALVEKHLDNRSFIFLNPHPPLQGQGRLCPCLHLEASFPRYGRIPKFCEVLSAWLV